MPRGKKYEGKTVDAAKRDVGVHGKARSYLNPRRGAATTKQMQTGGTTIVNTAVHIPSGEKGSAWHRAVQMKRGDCGHLIGRGLWFYVDPKSADVICVKCAPEGAP